MFKLNKSFRSTLVNNFRRFELIIQIKNYFILIDNVRRQIQAEIDRETAIKKVVEHFKSFSLNCSQLYFRQIIIITRIIQSIAIISAFTTEIKIKKKKIE